MAQRRTNEEILQDLELKKRQIENRMKDIKKREDEKERKQRTRRLIENGALAEKYLQAENIAPADFEKLLARLVHIEQVKNILGSSNPPIGGEANGQAE